MLIANFSTRKRFQNQPLKVFITRTTDPFGGKQLKISGAEPKTRDGEINLNRHPKLVYNASYTQGVIETLNGCKELSNRDKRRKKKWSIKLLEIGQSPIPEKKGRPEKPKMGNCKAKITWGKRKLSTNTLSQVSWSNIRNNLTGRIK